MRQTRAPKNLPNGVSEPFVGRDELRAMFERGGTLKKQGKLQEAMAVLSRLVDLQPEYVQAHFRLGTVLSRAAMAQASAASYRRALALQPNHPGALLGLGHMLKALGDPSGAIAAYQRCIALQPDRGEIYYSLANLKTYTFAEEEINQMQRHLGTADLPESTRVNFLFALANAHEQRDDYAAAWCYFQKGNNQQRRLIDHDSKRTEEKINRLINCYTREFFQRSGGWGNADASPIFIVGLPRSGSTLIEQIIASHSAVEGTGELPYIGTLTTSLDRDKGNRYPQAMLCLPARHFAKLGERFLKMAKMHRVENAPRFVDKMPNNFSNVGFIHAILPNAKIIDARRDPMDACVGNLKQLYARGHSFSYNQTEVGEHYLQYQRIMDHWNEVLPGRILQVRYEDTVGDLETQVRRILKYLDLPWEDNCMNYHRTKRAVYSASSAQVRQPIYTSGINSWKNYEPNLDELNAVLSPIRTGHA